MITVTINETDQKRFMRQVEKLAKVTDQEMRDVLKQQGRLIAIDAIGWTDRISGAGKMSAAAGVEHKDDVKKTIYATYRDAAHMAKYLNSFGKKASVRWMNYLKRKEVGKMQNMVNNMKLSRFYGGKRIKVMAFDDGRAHRRRLKGTGIKNTINLVVDFKKVGRYAKEKINNVGRAKSGWARAAAQLGDSLARVPAYIKTSHHKVRGYGRVTGRSSKLLLTIKNNAEYGTNEGILKGRVKRRIRLMRKNIKHILDAQAKKHIEKI